MPIHSNPLYGLFEPGWRVIPSFPDYEANHDSQVRNKKTGHILSPNKKNRISIFFNGKQCIKAIYHLSLITFFPHIKPMETVDHIDENYNNNYIGNLQWMNRGGKDGNSAKSRKLKPINTAHAKSKPIIQWTLDGKIVNEFVSASEAARELKIDHGSICTCARGERLTYKGFKWTFKPLPSQEDLPGEKWDTSDCLKNIIRQRTELTENAIKKIKISNLGRILTANNIKTKGKKEGRGSPYRCFHNIFIHTLVWAVWGNRSPGFINNKPEIILHNDKILPDKEGCVNNAIEHLSLGTHSENTRQSYAHGNLGRNIKLKRKLKEAQLNENSDSIYEDKINNDIKRRKISN